jgi:uncharacterized protein
VNHDLILAEWQRGYEALRAAELLATEGWYADAISRAYYATLHAAKAILLTVDVAPESHAAARRLFGLHLVKTGKVEREWAVSLAHSLDDRIAADYDVEISFSREETDEECQRAMEFQNRMRQYLISQGFEPNELKCGSSKD